MKFETIKLDGIVIQYRIIPKKNKNTYFKFRKDGTIEITKSRYQSKREIIQYMKEHASHFAEKIQKVQVLPTVKEGFYSYFGVEYQIKESDDSHVHVDPINQIIYIPSKDIDPQQNAIKKAERNRLLFELQHIEDKYMDNPYVDITGIQIKARHTKTRFGSCNASKRTINMNANLVHYDRKYLEYVFVHEICHLTHQNHSKEYYSLLETLYPNYLIVRKELREIYR